MCKPTNHIISDNGIFDIQACNVRLGVAGTIAAVLPQHELVMVKVIQSIKLMPDLEVPAPLNPVLAPFDTSEQGECAKVRHWTYRFMIAQFIQLTSMLKVK